MHVETVAYMLHQLPLERKVSQSRRLRLQTETVSHRMVEIPSGVTTLGLGRGSDGFGWDNEYEAHTASVPAFEIDRYKVTNRQFLRFVNAGGYESRALWSDEDWDWRTAHGISHPVFWATAGTGWFYRTMFEKIPLPLNWPVYVSHGEAMAYARWAGKHLPTEEEWHRACYGSPDGVQRHYPWGSEAPDADFGNFDFRSWDPAPVNAFPLGESGFGVHGMLGNGWEWTSSVFAPFPGFEPFPFYRGYSVDFFDGKHFVMKGGSARTAACLLRPTFRNWFQAHYQYVYAGFRCVSR
jgi:ergothioneine biosynthesis protein EgtB